MNSILGNFQRLVYDQNCDKLIFVFTWRGRWDAQKHLRILNWMRFKLERFCKYVYVYSFFVHKSVLYGNVKSSNDHTINGFWSIPVVTLFFKLDSFIHARVCAVTELKVPSEFLFDKDI